MKLLLVVLVLKIFVLAESTTEEDMHKKFSEWMVRYNKCIKFSPEVDKKFKNFMIEYNIMLEQNKKFEAKKSIFRMDLNKKSAYSIEEKKKTWHGLKLCGLSTYVVAARDMGPIFDEAPASIDYRAMGYVTDVKDQGDCGCCYAFASMCALEGQMAKKYGTLVSLSEQNIVDCSRYGPGGNWGCDGGFAEVTFQYIIDNNGVDSSDHYPYTGFEKNCSYNPIYAAGNATGYQRIKGDEEYLKRALAAIGPLVVGLRVDFYTFYGYSKGIYDDLNCYGEINHAMSLVGYGTEIVFGKSVDYWIIKNSWSSDWGENGYMRILRGINLCNITRYIVYPIV